MNPDTFGAARRTIQLVTSEVQQTPMVDVSIGPALLSQVAGHFGPEWLRMYRPTPTLAFSGRDCTTPGIRQAARAARAAGFTPVRRGPGGRAAAYHEGALCLDHISPDRGISSARDRFSSFGGMLTRVLRTLGVDARLGPVPGEYCPGDGHRAGHCSR